MGRRTTDWTFICQLHWLSAPPREARGKRCSTEVFYQAHAGKLPACGRIEEVAVAFPGMARRRRERAAAQHHLIDHELAIVFAERTVSSAITRIGKIGAARPLPDNAEGVLDEAGACGHLPLRFGWQVLAGPARER